MSTNRASWIIHLLDCTEYNIETNITVKIESKIYFILFVYFYFFSLRFSTLHSAVMHHEAGLPTHNQTSEEEEAPSMHRGPVALLLPEENASGTMQSHPDVER